MNGRVPGGLSRSWGDTVYTIRKSDDFGVGSIRTIGWLFTDVKYLVIQERKLSGDLSSMILSRW